MSDSPRINLSQAREAIADLDARVRFGVCCEKWIVAGSYRRAKSAVDSGMEEAQRWQVGDVEICCIPIVAERAVPGSLFPETRNRLWDRIDTLRAQGVIVPARYGEKRQLRWGEKTRGFDFQRIRFEIYSGTETGYGKLVAIRTGPQEHSAALVQRLTWHGFGHKNNEVLDQFGNIVACPWEREVYDLVKWPCLDPHQRAQLCHPQRTGP